MEIKGASNAMNVVTLAFSSRPMQGLPIVQAKNEAQKSHFMLP